MSGVLYMAKSLIYDSAFNQCIAYLKGAAAGDGMCFLCVCVYVVCDESGVGIYLIFPRKSLY